MEIYIVLLILSFSILVNTFTIAYCVHINKRVSFLIQSFINILREVLSRSKPVDEYLCV